MVTRENPGLWNPSREGLKQGDRAVGEDAGNQGIHPFFLTSKIWELKAERDGYPKVAPEIDQYLSDHMDDTLVRNAIGRFAVEHDRELPADFLEHILGVIDAKQTIPKESLNAELAFNRAVGKDDPHERLTALDQLMAKYPKSQAAEWIPEARFNTLVELQDLPGAEAAFARWQSAHTEDPNLPDPNVPTNYQSMADLYIDKGVKFEAALKLLDEATQRLKSMVDSDPQMFGPGFSQSINAQLAESRARAYVALRKPALALEQAHSAVSERKKSASAHEILASAYAEADDKRSALDEYFEAALLPSNDDLKYRAELKRY